MESLYESGVFKIKNYKSKEIIFHHLSVKENVFNTRKNRYEETNRFRNGDITQHLISVDIQIVRSDAFFVDILEGFICDNLDYNPIQRFLIDMTEKKTTLGRSSEISNKH